MLRPVLLAAALSVALSGAVNADSFSSGGPMPPAMDVDTAAVLAGKAWSTGTGPISIPANQQLDVTLTNPSGSGCTALLTLRRFSNASGSDLSFTTYSNPAPITAVTRTPGNRMLGAPANTGMTLGFATRVNGSMGGTAGVSSPIVAKEEQNITVPMAVPPGGTLGVSIMGLSGLLSSAVTVAVSFAGFCA